MNRGYRFSDRDSLMRAHWGLGVGHIHAHNKPPVPQVPTPGQAQTAGGAERTDAHNQLPLGNDDEVSLVQLAETESHYAEIASKLMSLETTHEVENEDNIMEVTDEDIQAEYSCEDREYAEDNFSCSESETDEDSQGAEGSDEDV